MTRLVRLLLLCLGLATATVAVAGPGMASGLHDVAHLAAPVDADEHHHHAADGSVVADHGHPDGGDDADGGHDHMLSGASPVMVMDSGAMLGVPRLVGMAHGLPVGVAPPPDRASAPPFQPPRFV